MSLAILVLQVLLAVAALWLIRRRVLPVVGSIAHGGVVVDVWLPLTIVAPLLVLATRIDGSVSDGGWPALGGPVTAGWIAVAAAMFVPADRPSGRIPWPAGAAALAGLIFMMLAAAHVMSVWMGQCTLAVAAVLLWIGTPATPHDGARFDPVEAGAGLALLLSLVAAIAIGVLALFVEGKLAPVADGLVMGYVVMAASSLIIAGGDAARRTAAWAAAYGVLLGLGVASLRVMLPAAIQILSDRREVAPDAVAYGFGSFAPEACALLVLAPAVMWSDRLPTRARRWAGAAGFVILAVVVGARLAS